MGSFAYMAPERFNGQPYGFSSDIWSLGLCVVECVTGKYPYEGLGAAPVPLMLAVRYLPRHISQTFPTCADAGIFAVPGYLKVGDFLQGLES